MTMDKISQILGGDTGIYEIVETRETTNDKGEVVYTEDEDSADYAKSNMKKVIDTGMRALPDMIRVLKDTDDPKMYGAASIFMESLTKLNKEYSEFGQPKQDSKSTPVNQTNTVNYNYLSADDALKQATTKD